MEDGNVDALSTSDSNNSGHCLTYSNCISMKKPADTKHIQWTSTIPKDMKKDHRVLRNANLPPLRKIIVQNTVY